jgi:hypothetical protein
VAIDPLFKSQLKQTIYIAALSSTSTGLKPTFGTAATRACRLEPDNRVVTGPDGTELATSYLIITEAEIPLTSCVWPNAASTPTSTDDGLRPKQVSKRINEDGTTHHWETWI